MRHNFTKTERYLLLGDVPPGTSPVRLTQDLAAVMDGLIARGYVELCVVDGCCRYRYTALGEQARKELRS